MIGVVIAVLVGLPTMIGLGVAEHHGVVWGVVAGLFTFAVMGGALISD